jgi:hypothetical protein
VKDHDARDLVGQLILMKGSMRSAHVQSYGYIPKGMGFEMVFRLDTGETINEFELKEKWDTVAPDEHAH